MGYCISLFYNNPERVRFTCRVSCVWSILVRFSLKEEFSPSHFIPTGGPFNFSRICMRGGLINIHENILNRNIKKSRHIAKVGIGVGRLVLGQGFNRCYLNNGDTQENTAKANGNGGGSHHSWSRKESHSHWESCNRIPTCYDPRLQCHEKTCTHQY